MDSRTDPDACLDEEILAKLLTWLRLRSESAGTRTLLWGIVGVPGSGKTTLAKRIAAALGLPRSLCVSLDDFYLTPEQRRQRDLPWRGPPGTHDLHLLDRFLTDLASRAVELAVPVFDRDHERRLPPKKVPGPISLCLFEGWFVGARSPGYERLADALDLLIYLDMDTAQARAARLSREAELRKQGRGMDEAEVIRFWDQALAPYLPTLVYPLRERADACLKQDADHHLIALRLG